VEYRKFGETDRVVSAIGMGCVTFGREIDEPTAFSVMDRAFERGITLFDTAAVYGEGASERIVGRWIADRGRRDDVFLATKLFPPFGRESVVRDAERSLDRLGVERVDLLQLHVWDENTPIDETLEALDTLVREGRVRYLGCSNFTPLQLCRSLRWQERAGAARFQSVQPIYNLVHREIEEEMLAYCADEQIGVITYSPLGAGFLTGKYTPGGPLPQGTRFDIKPGHQDVYFSERGFAIVAGLRKKAEELGRSMVQLALSWAMHRPGLTSVLIGARNSAQVDQAFDAWELDMDFGWADEL